MWKIYSTYAILTVLHVSLPWIKLLIVSQVFAIHQRFFSSICSVIYWVTAQLTHLQTLYLSKIFMSEQSTQIKYLCCLTKLFSAEWCKLKCFVNIRTFEGMRNFCDTHVY
jgi:hypothetical protein